MRLLPALMAVLVPLFLGLAAAAQPAIGSATAPAARSDAADSADLTTLIRILRNETTRNALIDRLQQAATSGGGPPAPSAPEAGFAGNVAEYTRDIAEQALAAVEDAGRMVANIAMVLRGAADIDPMRVWGAVLEVLAVLVVTSIVYVGLRWIGLRIGQTCDRHAIGTGRLWRGVLLLAANLADTVCVILAWGAGYVFALGLGGVDLGRLDFGATNRISFGQTLFLNAFLFVELGKVGLRLLTVPMRTNLRLLPLDDTTAAYWYFWSSRLASLLGYSFLFAAPLLLYSGSWAGAQSIRVLAMLSATAISVAVVLQNRDPVRAALTRRLSAGQADTLGRVAAYLGSVWHLIAIAYVLTVLFVWLTNPGAALAFMLQATLQSAVAAGLGMVVVAVISRFISTGLHLPQEVRDRLPLLEGRLNAFVPAVLRVVRMVVLGCVLITMAQTWGLLNFLGWLASGTGRQVTGAVMAVLFIVLIGSLLHVAMASWVEYRVNPNFGSVPSARERTLLSLFRNAFTIALVVLVVMLVLSQIGVNIAPLLAGAGVIGLAIGFGAQKLVQDMITGVFIQLENAMNEGEVVSAGGVTGVVERLTIRSVSIRDVNGVLHVMPFSSVERVSNLMRHFSYHVAVIGVAYRENITEVKAAMQEAFDQLLATEHGLNILGPLDMHGIVAFGDSAINVRARIKTLPGKHLALGRAYSELIKEVFDARGIEIAFPHLTLYLGEDKRGHAPPLRVRPDRPTGAPPSYGPPFEGPSAGIQPSGTVP